MIRGIRFVLAISLVCSVAGRATAQEAAIESVRVFPSQVTLQTAGARQLVVVQAVFADGITRDVSSQAQWTLANPALAVPCDGNTLWPAADGETELKVDFGGKSLAIPVTVGKAAEQREISFKLDVMPIFMKAGCNSGSCHGAARGKDGFRLSLFGFDPDGDLHRLTRELSGRRLDLAVPMLSLAVEKSTGDAVPPTGGEKRFAPRERVVPEFRRLDRRRLPCRPGHDSHLHGTGDLPQASGAGWRRRHPAGDRGRLLL